MLCRCYLSYVPAVLFQIFHHCLFCISIPAIRLAQASAGRKKCSLWMPWGKHPGDSLLSAVWQHLKEASISTVQQVFPLEDCYFCSPLWRQLNVLRLLSCGRLPYAIHHKMPMKRKVTMEVKASPSYAARVSERQTFVLY